MSTTPPSSPHTLTPAATDALLLDTNPWLSCDDCFTRMDAYAEAVVQDPEYSDPAMAAHLRGCGACQEEAESLIALLREED